MRSRTGPQVRTRAKAAACAAVAALAAPAGPAVSAGDPYIDKQYGLQMVQARAALSRARGAGVLIAVIDTGVDLRHEDLRERIVPGHDYIDDDDDAQDANGHGTHVAGVAAATADNGLGIAGVAPAAMILPLRVLDANGRGIESDVASAIRFSVLRARTTGVKLVVNLSLTDLKQGGGIAALDTRNAIRDAWRAGAVVVAAAGNESLPFSKYPAEGPNVLSVGAIDDRQQHAAFSNKGVNLVAPGEKILSAFWDRDEPDAHDLYAVGSGTSVAAPHVSGAAALLLSAGLTNEQAVDAILRHTDDLGPPGQDPDFGFGLLNVSRALGLSPAGAGAAPVAGAGGLPDSVRGRFERLQPEIATPTPAARAGSVAPARSSKRSVLPLTLAAAVVALALPALVAFRRRRSSRPTEIPWDF
ncbi:MAG TPA: S8 family serine peptidase [Actinomycetota bacterium]|nr:S8 family serine peptidase [Actinomycetota bacterium]